MKSKEEAPKAENEIERRWCDSCGEMTTWINGECENYPPTIASNSTSPVLEPKDSKTVSEEGGKENRWAIAKWNNEDVLMFDRCMTLALTTEWLCDQLNKAKIIYPMGLSPLPSETQNETESQEVRVLKGKLQNMLRQIDGAIQAPNIIDWPVLLQTWKTKIEDICQKLK